MKIYNQPDFNEINEIFKCAEQAFYNWRQTEIKKRIYYLKKLRKSIVDNIEKIVQCSKITGKVYTEALASDVLATLEIIKYYEKNAERILKTRKRKTPFIFRNNQSYVLYQPIGVILIISPWNYPFQLSIVPLISAILAGNTVVLKPSEKVASIGNLIVEMCEDINLPNGVVQVVSGGADTGELLIKAGPDKIFFTGSTVVGKAILESAAKKLIPVELELGGKDPMIVFSDCNFRRAIDGAVYGAFSNSGQICVSIERLYVQESIYEKFVDEIVKRVKKLSIGVDFNSDIGSLATFQQIEYIDSLIDDAISKGAKLITERKRDK
jgi:acyl-CoA reductase-like NAD-dependent aldehyde dehydrogenase